MATPDLSRFGAVLKAVSDSDTRKKRRRKKWKIEDLSQEVKRPKVKQLLEDAPADQKADAIMQSIEMIQEATHAELIGQVVAEAERASHDAEYKKQLDSEIFTGRKEILRKSFKDIRQSITAKQIDINSDRDYRPNIR